MSRQEKMITALITVSLCFIIVITITVQRQNTSLNIMTRKLDELRQKIDSTHIPANELLEPAVQAPTGDDVHLSFNLPPGWYRQQTKGSSTIQLVSTNKTPLFGGIRPDDYSPEKYDSQAGVITVTLFDLPTNTGLSRPIAKKDQEVTDLGNGFFKVKVCDTEKYPECSIYGQSAYEYFFRTPTTREIYEFTLMTTGPSAADMEKIILSAKEAN